jgi:hypothetical protein
MAPAASPAIAKPSMLARNEYFMNDERWSEENQGGSCTADGCLLNIRGRRLVVAVRMPRSLATSFQRSNQSEAVVPLSLNAAQTGALPREVRKGPSRPYFLHRRLARSWEILNLYCMYITGLKSAQKSALDAGNRVPRVQYFE